MTNPITKFIEENRKVCEGATEGPWVYEYYEPYCAGLETNGKQLEGIAVWLDDAPVPDYNAKVDANAQFIATSRTSLPLALEALEKCIDALTDYQHMDPNCTDVNLFADEILDEITKILGGEGE